MPRMDLLDYLNGYVSASTATRLLNTSPQTFEKMVAEGIFKTLKQKGKMRIVSLKEIRAIKERVKTHSQI